MLKCLIPRGARFEQVAYSGKPIYCHSPELYNSISTVFTRSLPNSSKQTRRERNEIKLEKLPKMMECDKSNPSETVQCYVMSSAHTHYSDLLLVFARIIVCFMSVLLLRSSAQRNSISTMQTYNLIFNVQKHTSFLSY